MKMFIIGFAAGCITALIPSFVNIGDKLFKAHKSISQIFPDNTVCKSVQSLAQFLVIYTEQIFKKSLVYSKEKKVFILSFILKGKLHQIYVKPALGPDNMKSKDPFVRGYLAICEPPL